MNTKCPKFKDGHQTIIYGDVSQRLKCKCEIPRYDNDNINKEREV